MGTKVFKSIMVVLLLVMAMTAVSVAQTYTKTYGPDNAITVTDFGKYYRFSQTFTTRDDTVKITLPNVQVRNLTGSDTTLFNVNVYTSDTAVIAVRYQVSSDGSNWKSFTIGTDSTTWAWGTAVAPIRTMNTFIISTPQYGGNQPYKRLLIYGYHHASRTTGYSGKIMVDVIPKFQ